MAWVMILCNVYVLGAFSPRILFRQADFLGPPHYQAVLCVGEQSTRGRPQARQPPEIPGTLGLREDPRTHRRPAPRVPLYAVKLAKGGPRVVGGAGWAEASHDSGEVIHDTDTTLVH